MTLLVKNNLNFKKSVIFCCLLCLIIIFIFKNYQTKIVKFKKNISNVSYINKNISFSLNSNLIQNNNQHTKIKTSYFVSAHLVGRLGNQLFITASSFGISQYTNSQWCLFETEFNEISKYVAWIKSPQICPEISFEHRTEQDKHGIFIKDLIEPQKTNIIVGNYLQSYKYFNVFSLPFYLQKQNWAKEWLIKMKINSAIHIRRGDHLQISIYKNMLPDINYFEAAIKLIKSKDITARFCVFSDDMEYVKQENVFMNMQFTENLTPDETMAIIGECKHVIMSVGTFGWWGTYFSSKNKGLKIYYNEKRKNSWWDSGLFLEEDHYPHTWIGLNSTSIYKILNSSKL